MNKPKIITVTLNPSLDRTIVVHYLGIGYHNRTQAATRLDPGGKGLNISRALDQMGVKTHAIVMLGNDANARAYRALLSDENFDISPITIEGQTRSNTIILDTGAKVETQITEDGVEVSLGDLAKVIEELRKTTRSGDIVVIDGTLPPGASKTAIAQFVSAAKEQGVEVAAIASGKTLDETLEAKPNLVTLTQNDLEGYFNYPVQEIDDVVSCARKIIAQGSDRVLVEMRKTGDALLVDNEATAHIHIVETTRGTSSGMWDALIAGYLTGRVKQESLEKSLELGAAAASYAASQIGHHFGDISEVKDFAQITEDGMQTTI